MTKGSAFVVLGMHRSGTSALAGVLHLLGGQLPRSLMPATAANEKGYFESDTLAPIHDRLLSSAGTHWYSWEKISASWFDSTLCDDHVDLVRSAAVSEFEGGSIWVVKDPRISRFYPVWDRILRSLDVQPYVLIVLRNPLEVNRSLQVRDTYDAAFSSLVWLRHMLDAERTTRGTKRSFVVYEDLLTDWRSVVERIRRQLAYQFPRDSARSRRDIDEFLSGHLRHHRFEYEDLFERSDITAWARGVITATKALQGDPDDASAMAALDTIAGEFDRACHAFSPAAELLQSTLDAVTANATALAEARQHDQAHIHTFQDERNRLEADYLSERQGKRVAEARAQQVELELDYARRELASAQEGVAALERDLVSARGTVAAQDRDLIALAQENASLKGLADAVEAARLAADLDRHRLQALLADLQQAQLDTVRQGEEKQRTAQARLAALRARILELQDRGSWPLRGYAKPLAVLRKGQTAREGELARRMQAFTASGLFDADWYLANHLDVEVSGMDPLRHFASFGSREGRSPGPNFDAAAYVAEHPEALAEGSEPLLHFLGHGPGQRLR